MENEIRFVTEYGKQLDCKAEGCDPIHEDNGRVIEWSERHWGQPNFTKPAVVNNHACRWVVRTITYSKWHPANVTKRGEQK